MDYLLEIFEILYRFELLHTLDTWNNCVVHSAWLYSTGEDRALSVHGDEGYILPITLAPNALLAKRKCLANRETSPGHSWPIFSVERLIGKLSQ